MIDLVLGLSALFLAIVLHEIAHGYMACILGDPTAKTEGRLSLNPVKHIDPIGTLVVPLALFAADIGIIFGWAKPVPVNYYNLKHFKRDVVLISAAGITANLILASISAVMLKLLSPSPETLIGSVIIGFFAPFILYNVILAVFNLIPLPPLDGSKIFFAWIGKPWAYKYLSNEKTGFGIIILFGFLMPSLLRQIGINFDPLGLYITETAKFIVELLL